MLPWVCRAPAGIVDNALKVVEKQFSHHVHHRKMMCSWVVVMFAAAVELHCCGAIGMRDPWDACGGSGTWSRAQTRHRVCACVQLEHFRDWMHNLGTHCWHGDTHSHAHCLWRPAPPSPGTCCTTACSPASTGLMTACLARLVGASMAWATTNSNRHAGAGRMPKKC